MTDYTSLAELVGQEHVLTNKTDLSKLLLKPIKIARLNGNVFDGVLYSENNHDFSLYTFRKDSSSDELMFNFRVLFPGMIARQPRLDNTYILTKQQGIGCLSQMVDSYRYHDVFQTFQEIYGTSFDMFVESLKQGKRGKQGKAQTEMMRKTTIYDAPYALFLETTIPYSFAQSKKVLQDKLKGLHSSLGFD